MVLSPSHINHAIELEGYHPPPFRSQREERDNLLCPVRALRLYIGTTQSFRRTEQLFVCFDGKNKGHALCKQKLSHWIVETIKQAFDVAGKPVPS